MPIQIFSVERILNSLMKSFSHYFETKEAASKDLAKVGSAGNFASS